MILSVGPGPTSDTYNLKSFRTLKSYKPILSIIPGCSKCERSHSDGRGVSIKVVLEAGMQ